MIRWYDIVLAFVFAALIYSFFIYGVYSESILGAMLGGGLAGLSYRIWRHEYCVARLIAEHKK